jgi:hypothetical protein
VRRPGNVHDGLVTGPAFRELRGQRVAGIVPPACDIRVRLDVGPSRFQAGHGARGIQVLGLAERTGTS